MKVNVKRSDLLRLYNIFNRISPELNTVYLMMDPYDYILLSKIVSSVFSNNSVLHVDIDDNTSVQIVYQSLTIDKNILLNILHVMDEQAILDSDSNIHVEFTNGLQILYLLENLLLGKKLLVATNEHFLSLIEKNLFSIQKKLGYASLTKQNLTTVKGSYLKIGDLVRVADNSGAKLVKIVSEIEPSVYIVTIAKTNLGYESTFPYGKKYCAVLVRFSEFGYYAHNEVCLFDYYDGIKEPLFSSILNGTVAPCTNLPQYEIIIRSCIFKEGDFIRVDSVTSAKIKKILTITNELEGSEFVVTLLSDVYLSPLMNYKKFQFVKGTLQRRPYTNKNSSLSYYLLDVYELQLNSLFISKDYN